MAIQEILVQPELQVIYHILAQLILKHLMVVQVVWVDREVQGD
jgi:hypothetical protein